MLSQDLESCAVSIGVLGGKVGEEEWAYLRMLRANLMAHAVQARRMELGLSVACAAAGLAEPSQTAPNPAPDKGGALSGGPVPWPFPELRQRRQGRVGRRCNDEPGNL